jgi:hypothetical protein
LPGQPRAFRRLRIVCDIGLPHWPWNVLTSAGLCTVAISRCAAAGHVGTGASVPAPGLYVTEPELADLDKAVATRAEAAVPLIARALGH